MGKSPSKSKEMREFAESVIKGLKEEPRFGLFNTEGLATSLVRQWLTYDGTAALHIGSALLFLSLTRSPLGAYSLISEPGTSNWVKELVEDWKVPEHRLQGLMDQLNLTQSAEITNSEGLVIRWFVNPKERRCGIEHNSPKDVPPPTVTVKLVRVAALLEKAFSEQIPENEIPILAQSIVDQWDRFHGHAAIFTEDARFSLFFEMEKEGGYSITTKEVKFKTRKGVENLGIPTEHVVAIIAQINLGRNYSFVDENGEQVDFWQEPDQQRFMKRIRGTEKKAPPFVCPGCGGVLGLWKEGINQQKCVLCGLILQRV